MQRNTTNYKPAYFDWVIGSHTQKKTLDPKLKEYFQGLPKDDAGKVIWGIVETMLPPIVASRFHAMDVHELTAKNKEYDHMAIAGWTCLWHESMGMPILHLVEVACQSPIRHERMAYWVRQMKKTTSWLRDSHTGSRYSLPNNEHNFCSTATGFILEPAVLIQLPWHYPLFHQWLLASLHEVLLFERASLEFRHWPIRTKVYESARALLFMVRSLKERLYIGLSMLVKNIINCPTGPWPFAINILEDVILHAVTPLRFLISGKAHKMLKIMKKWLWSSSEPFDRGDMRFLMHNDFFVEETFNKFFTEQCYSPNNWVMSEARYMPFKDLDVEGLFDYLNSSPDEKVEGKAQRIAEFQPLYHQHKTVKPYPLHFMLKNCKDLIQEHVLKPGRIKEEWSRAILTTFDTEDFEKKAKGTFKSGKINMPQVSVMCSLLYWYTRSWQEDLQGKRSVLAKILSMQLGILEREQIVRLTRICSETIQETPLVTNIDPTHTSVAQEEKEMKEYDRTIKNMECMTKQQFWQQVPMEWRRKPSNDIQQPKKTHTIASLQIRIGKIIYTAARKSFDRQVPFPLWRRVQYILPSFLASFELLPEELGLEISGNYLKFLHNTLLFHEAKLDDWLKNPQLSMKKQGKCVDPTLVNFELVKLMNILNKCLNNRLKAFVETFTLIPGFEELANNLLHWPQHMVVTYSDPDSKYDDRECTNMTFGWQNTTYDFYRDMLTICQQTWPFADTCVIPNIHKLVKISDLLCDLSTGCMLIYVLTIHSKPPVFDFEIGRILRTIAFHQVLLGDEEWLKMLQKQRKMMKQLYSDIKKFCKDIPKEKTTFLFLFMERLPHLDYQYVKRLLDGNWNVLDNEVKELFITGRKCKKCSKQEKKIGRFIACETCLEQKYPDVHYFCSVACKNARWQEEHMAEHLEFELGLGQYADSSLLTV